MYGHETTITIIIKKVQPKTIEPRGKWRGKHPGTGLDNNFLAMTPKEQTTKAKRDDIKLKGFCTAKETIDKMRWQPMGWEKIFANYVSDKRLTAKAHKELIKRNSKKNPKRSN